MKTKGLENTKDTLIILCFDDDPSNWKAAAQQLYEVVENAAPTLANQFRVEIRNERRMYRDTSTAIIRNTDVHQALLVVQPLVEEAVRMACPDSWSSISYHMRGPRDQEGDRKPTVMVMIKPGTRHIWDLVEQKIDEALQSAKIPMDIAIYHELYSGYLLDLPPLFGKAEPSPYSNLPANPKNGSSIGPRGSNSTGSLGAFVYFQPEGQEVKKLCVMTCYHVICSGDPSNQATTDRIGIGLKGQNAPQHQRRIPIDYPSSYDTVTTRKALEALNGPLSKEMKDTLETIKRHKHAGGIGEVICASGRYQGANLRRMDWALIELKSPTLFSQNKPPVLIDPFDLRQKYLPLNRKYIATDNDVVSKVGAVTEGAWVVKTGRNLGDARDGVTAGDTNAMNALIHRDNAPSTRETVINNHVSGRQFAERGDFGSMVTNWNKEWVGIVMSGESTNDTAYMMLAQEIIDDVKAKTGGTITLP
jgi:hypothetical protein